MATLTATLTLSSSDVSSDVLSLTVSKGHTVGEPSISSTRVSVTTGAAVELVPTSSAVHTWVYIKNQDASNAINVRTGADVVFAELDGGDFMLFPLKASQGLEVIALSATCIVEYGYWSQA